MSFSFKKLLIPHDHNDHHPHLLRNGGLTALFAITVIAFGVISLSSYGKLAWLGQDYIASVLPSVLVDMANGDRSSSGLGGLTLNPVLEKAAQMKADDMVTKGYFAHNSPEGLTPWHWLDEVGYKYAIAGENLAVNFSDSEKVNKAWMNSPLHRANIMNGNFTEVGIATAPGVYKGRQTTFIVQMFGKPTGTILGAKKATKPVESPAIVTSPIVISPAVVVPQNVLGESVTATPISAPTYGTALSRILTNPSSVLETVLLVIASLIFFCLVLMFCFELSRKHIKHMLYSILLLIVIAVLLYVYKSYIIATILVQ